VTGGAGFIGSHLVSRLAALGHEVVVLDDLSWGAEQNLPKVRGVEFIHDDVRNVAAHAGRLTTVTRVFHLAALISGYDSLKEPEAYVATNIVGLTRVIEFCRKLARPRLVFASTSGVYGNSDAQTRRETDAPQPATVYALTKLAGEHLLDMYRDQVGYDDVSLRLFNVYGPRQNPDHPYANVTCKFAKAAALNEPVKLYGDGTQTRDFVYVDDVVDVMLAVSEKSTRRRVYNVGTGVDTSIASLLETVQRLAGAKLAIEQCPPWPNDIQTIRADVTRLRDDLGWEPKASLSTGLAHTIEFFRERAERALADGAVRLPRDSG
jgi:UDP-glucose 4-epimerase